MDQSLVDRMVEKAIAYCADKNFKGDVKAARKAFGEGRCDACNAMTMNLVRQVSEYLGQMDRTVKAVYQFEPEHSTNRVQRENEPAYTRKSGINLIAWVERKSAALSALVATLESSLAESRHKIGCKDAEPMCYAISVGMVDDRDVNEARGYGAMVKAMYVRSSQVWARKDVAEHPIPGALTEEELSKTFTNEFFD
jgi:hypothetical protein